MDGLQSQLHGHRLDGVDLCQQGNHVLTQAVRPGADGEAHNVLRGNGGGSLREAVLLSALFVQSGPVVQIRDLRTIGCLPIPPGNPIAFRKPMVVLTDRASASASEIVAGHLQDTGRAVVIGDRRTHGKGTVQSVMGLGPEKYGSIKVTTARFYRINGRSTQVEGVPADIHLPSLLDSLDIGEDKLVDVVCGAPNVAVGLKVPFAKLGAQIGDITIAPRKLAGYTSNGMCCSEKELGISDNNDGLMILDPSCQNGTDIKELFDIDDIIFEVDNKSLTNRPDLWGHYGIAREFAAIAGRELKPLDCADLNKYADLPAVDMKIEDPLCQRYSCLQVENITRKVSPVNMRIRLYYCGMRAINFLTDITNYIMLEMGQPMHAFDSRKVEKLRIKRYDHKFSFKTLDGVDRNIDEDMLMICNGDIPVCIAGVMGGLDSEIVDDTTKLTLECATFDAVSVRKTTVRLAHRTDASQRYEKCLDPEMTPTAVARFVKIMQDADPEAKVISSLTDEQAYKYPTITFSFDKSFVNRYTGIEISGAGREYFTNSTSDEPLCVKITRDGTEMTVDIVFSEDAHFTEYA